MKTSLSPIALVALLVGPGLAAWARQDVPQEPVAPLAAPPTNVDAVRDVLADPANPFLVRYRLQDDAQELSDEERALQEQLVALETRAAQLETMLADRLAQQEDAANAAAVEKERVGADLRDLLAARENSEKEREALEANVRDYILMVDPQRELPEVGVKELLESVPERLAVIQDEEVKAKIAEALQRTRDELDAQQARKAELIDVYERAVRQTQGERIDRLRLVEDRYQRDAEVQKKEAEAWRTRAEEMRAQVEALQAEIDRGGFKEAHSRYKQLTEQVAQRRAEFDRMAQRQAWQEARDEMEAFRDDDARQKVEREVARVTREESRRRNTGRNAQERNAQERRRFEQELAERESQRRTEERRLRTELESERRRLSQARAQLEQARNQAQRDFAQAEPPQRGRRLLPSASARTEPSRPEPSRPGPSRAEPSRAAHSDVTIIVEQGDVHVHTGGGSPQVITAPPVRPPGGNVYFDTRLPRAAPPAPEAPGTTQAPKNYHYWRVPSEGEADPNARYRMLDTFTRADESFPVLPNPLPVVESLDLTELPVVEYLDLSELPAVELLGPAELPLVDLAIPDIDYTQLPVLELTLPEIDLTVPEVEIEVLDVFFNDALPLETAPECESESDAVVQFQADFGFGDAPKPSADDSLFDLAAVPAERAPTQAELLERIRQLSEELKAEVGALRSELRELREVVRRAPQR